MPRSFIALAVLLLSACSSNSQPLAPTAAASSPPVAAVTTQATGHFDPPPLEGWVSSKWHDLSYTSPKYVFGRALAGLDPTEENLQRVATAQGLTYLGNGRVRFPDGTVVDAIYDLNGPRAHWQYSVE